MELTKYIREEHECYAAGLAIIAMQMIWEEKKGGAEVLVKHARQVSLSDREYYLRVYECKDGSRLIVDNPVDGGSIYSPFLGWVVLPEHKDISDTVIVDEAWATYRQEQAPHIATDTVDLALYVCHSVNESRITEVKYGLCKYGWRATWDHDGIEDEGEIGEGYYIRSYSLLEQEQRKRERAEQRAKSLEACYLALSQRLDRITSACPEAKALLAAELAEDQATDLFAPENS